MVIKVGRYGKFLACRAIPSAKTPRRLCRKRRASAGVRRQNPRQKSKKGKTYFGCEHNPQCPFMTWDKPTEEKCPKCGSTLFQKAGRGGKLHCLKEGCGYEKE